ncbi:MAG: 16S rRNA (cytidine(1402)-2'-O)-methyltransferase [Clostridia bacterium]
MAELFVVATPIGNLNDLTPRACEALSTCDLIAAEDTRVTMKLLSHLKIKKPMISCHRHNEAQKADGLIERMLSENLAVCLTCDAGTPGISAPGFELVRAARMAGIRVTPVCGASAVVAHLSACGFDAREFAFYGFPPREGKALREHLARIARTGIPIAVMYESPHRVVKLVETIAAELPGCEVSVACDISKLYEKILTGDPACVLQALRENPNVEKGEYAVVIDLAGVCVPEADAQGEVTIEARLLMDMLAGAALNEAADAALQAGCARNDLYRAKIRVKQFLEGGWAQ